MILLRPEDDGYPAEVAPFNTRIQQKPDYVAAPASVDEVVEAVAFAQEQGLRVSVQAAGHTEVAITDGLLISTRRLDGFSIDPQAKTATVQAGVEWGAVIAAASEHQLLPISGSASTVSVVGLMLGGGLGPLARSHGFSSDYMVSATVVTSAGDVLQASADSEPDLFWALRGGKKVPGVVTDMTFRLAELLTMYAGALYFNEPDIEGALRAWIDWTGRADPRVTTSVLMIRMPDMDLVPAVFRGRKLLAVRFAFPGPSDEGAQLAAPIRDLGTIYVDDLGEMPSSQVARIHNDPADPGPSFVAAMLLSHVDQKFASIVLDMAGPDVQTPFGAVEIRHLGAATARDVPEGSAVSGRSASFTFGVVTFDPGQFASALGAVNLVVDELLPWTSSEGNSNFMGAPRSPEQWIGAWPAAMWTRLAEINRRYDPDGLFIYDPASG